MAPLGWGLFLYQTQMGNTKDSCVDLDLVDTVVSRIPEWTWPVVRDAIVTNLVDEMPSDVLERLTGDKEGFIRAEEILTDYYSVLERRTNLIGDAFNLLGEENTLYLLDALQLDKYAEPDDEGPINSDEKE
jgi:hypothetical protein